MAGRWDFPGDILELEARALAKLVDRAGACEPVMKVRMLLLGDKMSVVLAFGRCRARAHGLLVQVRRCCAVALARGIRFHFRWIPSEFNSADLGRRIFDVNYDGSKSLVQMLSKVQPTNTIAKSEKTQFWLKTPLQFPSSWAVC